MSKIPQLGTLSGQTVSRVRRDPPSYIAGRSVLGSEITTGGICASVQPPTERDYFSMMGSPEEGKRTKSWIKVYCDLDTFREADDRANLPSDLIIYEGDTYEVYRVSHRRGRHLRHEVVFAVMRET